MHEYKADLWRLGFTADAVVITTNGDLRKDGSAVMGVGCAKQAAAMDPGLPSRLGAMIAVEGNHVHIFHGWYGTTALVAFPVKHHWREAASRDLICASTIELLEETDRWDWDDVILPRPGCGAGGLEWYEQVRPLVSVVLDNRFTVVWQ